MHRVVDEVLASAKAQGIKIDETEPDIYLEVMCSKYCSNTRVSGNEWRQFWDEFVCCSAVHNSAAWSRISEFLESQKVTRPVMIIQDCHHMTACRFYSSRDVVSILSDCTGFVFYIVDQSEEFVLTFNDHDMLIGVGSAKAWIESRRTDFELTK